MKLGRLLHGSGLGPRRVYDSNKIGPEKKKEKKVHQHTVVDRICRFWRDVLPWVELGGNRICVPPTTEGQDGMRGLTIDADEWRVVQGNFAGPVGQWYASDDANKPEVFIWSGITAAGDNHELSAVPQYQHQNDDDDETSGFLPPYEWARLACLPTPVAIDDSWSSLLAAQREKSRLLETQSYISSRIADIDAQVRAAMDAKRERDPNVHQRYCGAQMTGALHSVGLPDLRTAVYLAVQSGRLHSDDEYEWLFDLDKVFLLRERLSPLSLLSPPPAY